MILVKRRIAFLLFLILMLSAISPALAATLKVNTSAPMDSQGRVKVSWKDSGNNSPYKLTYKCISGTSDQPTWIVSKRISAKSYTIPNLIPGKKYKITVEDCEGNVASANIKVGRRTNVYSSRKRTEKIYMGYKEDEYVDEAHAVIVKNKSASAMERHIKNGGLYGIYYYVNYKSTMKKAINHYAIFALTAPNGYAHAEYMKKFTLRRAAGISVVGMVGDSFFTEMYNYYGYVPTGTYTFQIFLEGGLYYSKKFSIGE